MRRALLDEVKDLDVKAAKALVKKEGHYAAVFPEGQPITLQARPNTVLLWERDGKIVYATAGDPLELS